MSYREALEAAGATVEAFKRFGSYQGDWWAKTSEGWISGAYGSCSGCDAFEAEFGYESSRCDEHQYDYDAKPDCADCQLNAASFQDRLIAFGSEYLCNPLTQEDAEKEAARNIEWDLGATEMVEWLKAHAL